jgi:riboflavin kinase/FMN adenylyltransferase
VETYLLDFDGDLYGSVLGLAFAARLRDQRRFESPAELVDRMRRDVAEVRRVIGPAPV